MLLSGVCSSGLRRVFMVGAFTWLGDGSNGLYHSCGFYLVGGMVPMDYTILVAFFIHFALLEPFDVINL